jgi:hypothetical protein
MTIPTQPDLTTFLSPGLSFSGPLGFPTEESSLIEIARSVATGDHHGEYILSIAQPELAARFSSVGKIERRLEGNALTGRARDGVYGGKKQRKYS